MKSIQFSKHYYVGAISRYIEHYDITEFVFENDEIYIIFERAYEDYGVKSIKGKALLKDIMYDYDKNFYIEMFDDIKNSLENDYKPEYYNRRHADYWAITIDDKEYLFSDYEESEIEDENLLEMITAIKEFCLFINIPTKLLKEILGNKPFNKK